MDDYVESCLRPSSSALVALDSLTPPSPVVESWTLNSSISGEIPIILSSALADMTRKHGSGDQLPYIKEHRSIESAYPRFDVKVIASQNRLVGSPGIRARRHSFGVVLEFNRQKDRKRHTEHDCLIQDTGVSVSLSDVAERAGNVNIDRTQTEGTKASSFVGQDLEDNYRYLETSQDDLAVSAWGHYPGTSRLTGAPVDNGFGEENPGPLFLRQIVSGSNNIGDRRESTSSPSSRRQLAIDATLATLEARCSSEPCSPRRPSIVGTANSPPISPIYQLQFPQYLMRLLSDQVELLIDQEGFRSVVARFRAYGIQNPDWTPSHRKEMAGMLLFKPTQRQKFLFHYGPLDGPPVLRRLTIQGEPSRDYLSRQASLCLRSNGIYVVRGAETSALVAVMSNKHQRGVVHEGLGAKLLWRFEYSVGDRPMRSPSRTLAGEKVLSPVSFACSPLLLHPVQGKRVRLMQVVKKALTPNLAAEKLMPPIGPLPPSLPSSEPTSPVVHGHIIQQYAVAVAHCTVPSVCSSELDDRMGKATVRGLGQISPTTELHASGSGQRRRASSAGERSHPQNDKEHYIVRHIIPPSQLEELFDIDTYKGNQTPIKDPLDLASTPLQSRPLSYQPLTPRPRFQQ